MRIAKALLALLMALTACICGCWYNQIGEAMFSQPLPRRLSVQIAPVSYEAEKNGLDVNQLRTAVERAFCNSGVEIVEPNSATQLSSRLIINLDVLQDPNTQLYTCEVELHMFDSTTDYEKANKAHLKVGSGPLTVNAVDMPRTIRAQLGSTLFILSAFYLSDEDKDQFMQDLLEGFFADSNNIPLSSQPNCQTKVLKNEQGKEGIL